MAPGTVIGDLPTALAAIEHCGAQLQLCLDTMHWARSGYGAADIDALDPNVIGYVQLSDTTMAPRLDSYLEEAMYERMAPGDGELPLRDILAAVAPDVVVGLEVPMRAPGRGGRQRRGSAATLRGRRAGVDVVNIAGKKAVVIGGASGLGRATAEALVARGADVAVLDQAGRRW